MLNPKENTEQELVVQYVEDFLHLPIYSIPNGFHVQGGSKQAHIREMAKLKRTGLRTGVPDLCVPVPSGPWHGLYIEMKRRQGGVLSPDQKTWIQTLNSYGYRAVVCKGFDEAQKVISEYLKEGRKDG